MLKKKNQQLDLFLSSVTAPVKTDDAVMKQPFVSVSNVFSNYQLQQKPAYISQEFQDFAYRLAAELDDLKHKSLYMRLAKNTERGLLEQALSFVSDAQTAKSKARLFMWKLKQLKDVAKTKI